MGGRKATIYKPHINLCSVQCMQLQIEELQKGGTRADSPCTSSKTAKEHTHEC